MTTDIPRAVVDNDVEGQRGCDGGEYGFEESRSRNDVARSLGDR